MANWEGSLERSPLEVEYRTRGSLLAKISTVLGRQVYIPESIHIVDSYLYFQRGTRDFRRVRKARKFKGEGPYDPDDSEDTYQEQAKIYFYGSHPLEIKRRISREEYERILEAHPPAVVVQGTRRELWIVGDEPKVEKAEDGLHVCFDRPEGLGDWTEFEIEIYGLNTMSPKERAEKESQAKERIFEFAKGWD